MLLVFMLAGIILLFILSKIIYAVAALGGITLQQAMRNPDILCINQFFAAVCMFLLPALGVAFVCSTNFKSYLSLRKCPSLKILFFVLLSMILLSPALNLLTLLNQSVVFPDFMEPVENWMKAREDSARELTDLLIDRQGFWSLITNLLVIAVMAGITEEFFFRGTLERIIGGWTQKPHLIIWIAAAIFSAIHMQFYGFLPRMVLGAYFGYLLLWSGNIWVPVFAHFLNNALVIICMSDARLKEYEFIAGEISGPNIMTYSIGSVFTLYLFFLCVRRLKVFFAQADVLT